MRELVSELVSLLVSRKEQDLEGGVKFLLNRMVKKEPQARPPLSAQFCLGNLASERQAFFCF